MAKLQIGEAAIFQAYWCPPVEVVITGTPDSDHPYYGVEGYFPGTFGPELTKMAAHPAELGVTE